MPRRLLITGLNGTIAPRLAAAARQRGWQVLRWDRSQADPADAAAVQAWLERERPDGIAHLATGPAAWAGALARHAAANGLPFVHTSTAMVFDHEPDGPHGVHDARTARDAYGRYKIECEDTIFAAHARATVVRIGWQIDATMPGNNMLIELDRWQQREGRVAASRLWCPACSFIDDSAAALCALLDAPQAGVVPLDSNADEGWRFDRIVLALRDTFGRASHWRVEVIDGYRHDQRLLGGAGGGAGGAALMPPLSARLPRLLGS